METGELRRPPGRPAGELFRRPSKRRYMGYLLAMDAVCTTYAQLNSEEPLDPSVVRATRCSARIGHRQLRRDAGRLLGPSCIESAGPALKRIRIPAPDDRAGGYSMLRSLLRGRVYAETSQRAAPKPRARETLEP